MVLNDLEVVRKKMDPIAALHFADLGSATWQEWREKLGFLVPRKEVPEGSNSDSNGTLPERCQSNAKKTFDWCLLGALGIIAAGCLVYYGVTLWNDPHTYLPGRKMRQGIWLSGDGARALAVTYMGGGLYFHARWLWRTLGFVRISEKLTYLSYLLILGGIIAMYGLSFYQ